MADDDVVFELPDKQKTDVKNAERELKKAKDLLNKLRAAGEAQPEAESKIDELEDRINRFKEAFEVE